MVIISRRIEFDAGHRVWGHEGKCARIHGHRYVAEINVTAPKLDGIGRVVDFSIIKELVGGWIDKFWDHNILLNKEDPLAKAWVQVLAAGADPSAFECMMSSVFGDTYPYLMVSGNPTAEIMAYELLSCSRALLSEHNLHVVSVKMYETPNCWAVAE